MKKTAYVYGLLCPDEEVVRYVGISEDPVTRLRTHLKEKTPVRVDGTPSGKQQWLWDLREQGKEPEFVILETVQYERPEEVSHTRLVPEGSPHLEAERRWIRKLRNEGHPLTNRYRGLAEDEETDRRIFQQAIERGKQLFG